MPAHKTAFPIGEAVFLCLKTSNRLLKPAIGHDNPLFSDNACEYGGLILRGAVCRNADDGFYCVSDFLIAGAAAEIRLEPFLDDIFLGIGMLI